MFEFIRTHQRLMQFVLLLLILPSFAFFGIESYMRSDGQAANVGKVGGVAITQQEFDAAQRDQVQRMQQQFGNAIDPKLFDSPEMKLQILEGIVGERALAWEIARANLMVSDDRLRTTIAAIPAAQENGAFSTSRYAALLAAQGMTADMFEARLRRDLAAGLVTTIMQDSAIVPKTVATRLASIILQQREVAEQVFRPSDFASQVKVTDEMRKAYYDSHGAEFEIPQQLKIEYLVLDAATAAKQVTLPANAAAEYYEQNRKRYETAEQRRASHILIAFARTASDADKQKARAKADEILAKVKAVPNDFAKLARENSQDPGSAAKGGDLDFFARGAMVPQFEEAAFKLQLNEIAGPVESEFGYHIIRLTGIKPAVARPLAEVKAEIEAEITRQLASRKFAELAEQFTNLVYDQSDSLKPAADKLKLTVQTADGVTRSPANPQAPYAHPKVIAALFADDALKNKRNTEAAEVAPSTLVAARVVEERPATKRPFDAVKDALTTKVTAQESARLARAAGAAKLAGIQGGSDSGTFGPVKQVGRGKGEGLPPEALAQVFKADVSKLPAYVGVELGTGGYGIYRVSKVIQPEVPDVAQRANISTNLARQVGELEFTGYLESIKTRAKVQLNKPYDELKANVAKKG